MHVMHVTTDLQHALDNGTVHRKQAKVLLVGESQAGKTCCMRALSNKPFEQQLQRTDGADIETVTICCNATDSPSAPSCWRVAQHISFVQCASGVVDANKLKPRAKERRQQFAAREYDQYHKVKQAKQASTTTTTTAATTNNNEMTTVQRSMESDATITTEQQELESIRLQMWDFAGQEVYYNTHQV
jgi:GTPase SAR1 family protein